MDTHAFRCDRVIRLIRPRIRDIVMGLLPFQFDVAVIIRRRPPYVVFHRPFQEAALIDIHLFQNAGQFIVNVSKIRSGHKETAVVFFYRERAGLVPVRTRLAAPFQYAQGGLVSSVFVLQQNFIESQLCPGLRQSRALSADIPEL